MRTGACHGVIVVQCSYSWCVSLRAKPSALSSLLYPPPPPNPRLSAPVPLYFPQRSCGVEISLQTAETTGSRRESVTVLSSNSLRMLRLMGYNVTDGEEHWLQASSHPVLLGTEKRCWKYMFLSSLFKSIVLQFESMTHWFHVSTQNPALSFKYTLNVLRYPALQLSLLSSRRVCAHVTHQVSQNCPALVVTFAVGPSCSHTIQRKGKRDASIVFL